MIQVGTQIAYTPSHCNGCINHPDTRFGFITNISSDSAVNFYSARLWKRAATAPHCFNDLYDQMGPTQLFKGDVMQLEHEHIQPAPQRFVDRILRDITTLGVSAARQNYPVIYAGLVGEGKAHRMVLLTQDGDWIESIALNFLSPNLSLGRILSAYRDYIEPSRAIAREGFRKFPEGFVYEWLPDAEKDPTWLKITNGTSISS